MDFITDALYGDQVERRAVVNAGILYYTIIYINKPVEKLESAVSPRITSTSLAYSQSLS